MNASTARSPDGTRIAYDAVGEGAPLVLLHGGFVQSRRSWWEAGYVERLQARARLLVLDLRGHGESDHPTAPEAYAAERLCEDVTAVLDAEGVARARVWGFSLGAALALQLARAGERVERLALAGAQLGSWLTPEAGAKMVAGMQTLAQAKQQGRLEQLPIPEEHKTFARTSDLAVAEAMYRAMPGWPIVEPEALRCPAYLYTGAGDAPGAASLRAHDARLRAVGARWELLEGLGHMGAFEAVARVLPACAEFLLGA